MVIPLKLENLLDGRVVEQDRIEYKKGWNPADTIRTICAYANDFPDMSGGYVVIGVEEENGRPLLPPVGICEDELDRIQNELFQYCNQIEPRYLPRLEVAEYQGRHLLYLWCPAGDAGPYSAPKDVLSKNKEGRQKEYWIKPYSVTTAAAHGEKFELFEKFDSVPFDDRVNRAATLDDIQLGHLRDFLVESDSTLAEDVYSRSIEDTLVSLEVANTTDVGVDIRNIALLMFCDHPEKFMPCSQIELVWFHSPEEEGADDFTEKTFSGPLFRQVKEALNYIKNQVLVEKVVKVPGRAEADRFFNFPYAALEEALANACQHKSYQIAEPIEIRIYLNRIMIINYPGPAQWIDMDKFRAGRAVSRRYRNRRIGEFFKELDLAEKKSTGITKILRSLEKNGSPAPTFETDPQRHSLETTFWIHEGFAPGVGSEKKSVARRTGEGIGSRSDFVSDNVSDSFVYNSSKNPLNTGDMSHDSKEGSVKNVIEDVTEKERLLLTAIIKNPEATAHEMATELGVNLRTVYRRLQSLKRKHVIHRIGSDAKGHWEIRFH